MRRLLAVCTGLLLALASAGAVAAGQLTIVGSDTLGELMQALAGAYAQEQPLQFQIQTPGSAAALPALAEGRADLGPMSRRMTSAEAAAYVARRGRAPGEVRIGFDAVAVFVHPDNPLSQLSLVQLAQIWAADGSAMSWRDLDPAAPPAQSLLRLGRNTASGTYEFFQSAALHGERYRADVVQFPGAGSIVAAVAQQRPAIGYSSVAHTNGLVKLVPLRAAAGDSALLPDSASVISGRYPLARPLYLYFNRSADGRTAPETAAFLRFVLGPAGQDLIRRQGLFPLPPPQANEESRQLQ